MKVHMATPTRIPRDDDAPVEHARARVIEQVRTRIGEQLRGAGVHLPEAALAEVTAAVLDDAVAIAIAWMEMG
jgi:hypothetical protein